jgi:hypothetical protein
MKSSSSMIAAKSSQAASACRNELIGRACVTLSFAMASRSQPLTRRHMPLARPPMARYIATLAVAPTAPRRHDIPSTQPAAMLGAARKDQ